MGKSTNDSVFSTDKEVRNKTLDFFPKDHPQGFVVCLSESGEAACIPHDREERNENVAIFGASGSGKTFAFTKPNLLACIDQGFSAIVNDLGGELFRKTFKLALEKGAEVRVLNLDPSKSRPCDGWNIIGSLVKMGPDDPRANGYIRNITETILENSHGDGEYFKLMEERLLEFLIRYVAFSEHFTGEKKDRTFERCCGILSSMIDKSWSCNFISDLFEKSPDDPAANAWNAFMEYNEKQKENAMASLSEKLRIFRTDYVNEIISGDSIDLSLPGRKQCIYYVISSFQDNGFVPLTSLFFSCAIKELTEEAGNHPNGKLGVPVMFILDEFVTIGKICGFPLILNNIHKYGISIAIVFHDIRQLERIYPGESLSIIAGCDTRIAFQINEKKTMDVIAARLMQENSISSFDAEKLLHKILRLLMEGKVMVSTRGCKIYKANKYGYVHHYLSSYVNNPENHKD